MGIKAFFTDYRTNRKKQFITAGIALLLIAAIVLSILFIPRGKTIFVEGKETVIERPGQIIDNTGGDEDPNEPWTGGGDFTENPDEELPPVEPDENGPDYTKDPDPDNKVQPPAKINTFVKSKKPYYTATSTQISDGYGYGSGETFFYNVDVSLIGADRTGVKDSTYVIQSAIDAVESIGGGTVYIPEGKYRVSETIFIPRSVTVIGDWKSPDCGGGRGEGTVFLIYSGRGDADASPQFMINGGMESVSFWYPQQDVENIVAYPLTIVTSGTAATLSNLTFYNSYRGINSLSAGCIKIKSIFGTFFRSCFSGSEAYDIPRVDIVRIDTSYWKNSGLQGAPTNAQMESLNKYTRYFLDALYVDGRMDWMQMFDIRISNANKGIVYDPKCIYGMIAVTRYEASHVNYGMYWVDNPHSLQVTDSFINASKAAIWSNAHSNGSVLVTTTTFQTDTDGKDFDVPDYCIEVRGKANTAINIDNCVFKGWNKNAIYTEAVGVTVSNSMFYKTDSTVYNGPNITDDGRRQSNNNVNSKKEAFTPEGMTEVPGTIPATPNFSREDYIPTPVREPSVKTWYNVVDYYNIDRTGKKDISAELQKVLDMAGKTGGFVVLPTGQYRLDHGVTVPTGVELRGMFHRPMHIEESDVTTMLMIYADKGTEEGAAITLEEGAGIKDFRIIYPEQGYFYRELKQGRWDEETDSLIGDRTNIDGSDVYSNIDDENAAVSPYPPTVKMDKNAWAYNLTPANSWCAFDLISNKCDNAIVSDVFGFARDEYIRVGNGSENVTIQYVHCNPTVYYQTFNNMQMHFLEDYYEKEVTFVKLGHAPDLKLFNNFDIFDHIMLELVPDPNPAYKNAVERYKICMFTMDASTYGVKGTSGANHIIDFINIYFVSLKKELTEKPMLNPNYDGVTDTNKYKLNSSGEPTRQRILSKPTGFAITTDEGFTGAITFYNSVTWGGWPNLASVNGGKVNFVVLALKYHAACMDVYSSESLKIMNASLYGSRNIIRAKDKNDRPLEFNDAIFMKENTYDPVFIASMFDTQ